MNAYIFINGIYTNPGSQDAWTDRAVTYINTTTRHKAEKLEYLATALSRRIKQQKIAVYLFDMIKVYRRHKFDVVLIGHSNGADIIIRTLKMCDKAGIHILGVHLLSPACSRDPQENKLNIMVDSLKIRDLNIYIAGKDHMMDAARLSKKILGFLGLGYGSLGGLSKEEAIKLYGKDRIVYREDFGHSTWFKYVHLHRTMKTILRGHHETKLFNFKCLFCPINNYLLDRIITGSRSTFCPSTVEHAAIRQNVD